MAPQKSRRSNARKAKPNARKSKTRRSATRAAAGAGEKPAVKTVASGSPAVDSQLAAVRPDFSCSLSLSNLVRLDWGRRQELFPHGPGVGKLERFGFEGRPYDVESLVPGATGNKFVYLYPEKRYYVVPIYEAGQSSVAPQRFLLVRNRENQEEPGPHIFVVEPLKPPLLDEPFAQLHIIGGEDDSSPLEPQPPTAGVVEAVLTAVDATADQPAETPAAPSSAPTTSSQPAIDDPYKQATFAPASSAVKPQQFDEPDDALLHCIDSFNQALGYSPACEASLLPLRDCLLSYVQQRYGWERIPIRINETQFDAKLGHYSVDTASLGDVPDGAIVAVQCDGYTSGGNVIRDAKVIVNRVSDRSTRLNKLVPLSHKQMYLEIVARQDTITDEVISDAANQVGVIDVIYSLLTIFATASPSRIRYLAEQLHTGNATNSLIRENLGRTPPLHLRYVRRTPEIYVTLKGAVEPLNALRQILIAEATRQSEMNYYLQADRTWLDKILHELRSDGLTTEDYKQQADDIARRLEQIAFAPEFAKNTAP